MVARETAGERDGGPLVDRRRGLVSRRIFSDQALYERELERVFGRCWLFLGAEALIPKPNDFMTTFMGEEPMLVCRDSHGQVRAYLNTCRHRGNAVCTLDRGSSAAFKCGYHGWTYSNEGSWSACRSSPRRTTTIWTARRCRCWRYHAWRCSAA